ncbi:MAG TPA: hypothetical protein VEQ35_08850 [Beijerinckia sp.]|jgi:hypothetical protein|nr:hypothetical protein [Beijerinckia sp.]
MKTYCVSVVRDLSDPRECRVRVVEQGQPTAISLDAFSTEHARKVAFDLVQLLRKTSPQDSVILDTYVEAEPADAERFISLLNTLLSEAQADDLADAP